MLELIIICQSSKVRLGRILVKQKNFTFPGREIVNFPLFSFSQIFTSSLFSPTAFNIIFIGVSSDTAFLINAISSEEISGGIVGVAVGVAVGGNVGVTGGTGVFVGTGVLVAVGVAGGTGVGVGMSSKFTTRTAIVAFIT